MPRSHVRASSRIGRTLLGSARRTGVCEKNARLLTSQSPAPGPPSVQCWLKCAYECGSAVRKKRPILSVPWFVRLANIECRGRGETDAIRRGGRGGRFFFFAHTGLRYHHMPLSVAYSRRARRCLIANDDARPLFGFVAKQVAGAAGAERPLVCSCAAMGKHLTPQELDLMHAWQSKGLAVPEIQKKIASMRSRRNLPEPGATTVRRALKGTSHKRGRVETRGRKKKLSARNLKAMDSARKVLIKRADRQHEVHWADVQNKARVPAVHRTTAARGMAAAGFNVKWRPARVKPQRANVDEAQRKSICNEWKAYPQSFWQKRVDLYMDNKRWDIPTTERGAQFLKMTKVRGHLRTPGEGLQKEFTKPDKKKHRTSTGGNVNVCAGIINGKVRIWHYLLRTWSGEAAEALYREVVHPALKKYRGQKRSYTILEDNDPTGYKSNLAKRTKSELGIKPLAFPTYSPDLNPLDYALWDEVESRMSAAPAPPRESAEAYKARLSRTAKAIPEAVIRKMLSSMKGRCEAIHAKNGGHITRY